MPLQHHHCPRIIKGNYPDSDPIDLRLSYFNFPETKTSKSMPTTASDGLEASPDRRPMLEKPHQSPPEIPALCSSHHAHWVARCAYRELFFGEQSPSNGERADLETRYYELCNIRTFMRVDNVDQDNLLRIVVSTGISGTASCDIRTPPFI